MQDFKTGHFLIKSEPVKDPSILSNYADKNAVFHYYNQKPFQDVTYALARKTVLENNDEEYMTPFVDFLKSNNRRITVNENKIRYTKTSKSRVFFRLLRTVANQRAGLRLENFEITVNTNALKPGDKIGPEEAFMYNMVIQSHPRNNGDGYAYTVRNADPNPHTFFPPEYLRENVRIVKRGSSNYSEASSDWGSLLWDRGTAVLTWEVGLFKTGTEFKITDEALKHVFTLTPCDEKGKAIDSLPTTFLSEAELHFVSRNEKAMEEDLLWGQYNTTIPDVSTNLPRQIGSGIFDFYRDGNIKEYSPSLANSDIRELTDYMEDVWDYNFGQIIFGTGRPGLELADQWIKREFGELTVIRDYEHYIERTGSVVPGGADAWRLKKPMFNTYELPVGGVVTFERWNWLDDRTGRGTKHPVTGKPLLGYHFIGTKFNGREQNSNIVLVNREGFERWGYNPGATGLYALGAGGKNIHTHSGRYATLQHENAYGLFVEDVNDFIWFRPNIK